MNRCLLLSRKNLLYFTIMILIVVGVIFFLWDYFGRNDPSLSKDQMSTPGLIQGEGDVLNADTAEKSEDHLIQGNIIWGVIVVLSLLVASLSITIAYLAFSWRKSIREEQVSMLPNEVIKLVKNLERAAIEETNYIKEFVKRVDLHMKESRQISKQTINGMKDIMTALTIFQKCLTEKDAEIEKLRKGGEALVYRNFLKRFIRVHRIIGEEIEVAEKEEKDTNILKDIRIFVEDALEESSVQVFHPEIGKPYIKTHGVAENPKTVPTINPDKNLLIESVLQPGYALITAEGQIVLKEAIVKVYEYQPEGS